MFEDNYNCAVQCAQTGVKTFLLDKPWNQDGSQKIPNLTRFYGWDDFLRKHGGIL